MKLVLTQDVPSLGKAGEVKEVAGGYARNFLLPRKMAVAATADELQRVQQRQDAAQRQQEKLRAQHQSLADRLAGVSITLKAKVGDQSRLYGSITAKDISDAIHDQAKIDVDRRIIELEDPIRTLGTHHVPVHVAGDLRPQITVVVEEI